MTPGEIATLMGTTVAQIAACRAVVESEVEVSIPEASACSRCRPTRARSMTTSEMLRMLDMTTAQLEAFRALVLEATAAELCGTEGGCVGCAVRALGSRIRGHLADIQRAKRVCRDGTD